MNLFVYIRSHGHLSPTSAGISHGKNVFLLRFAIAAPFENHHFFLKCKRSTRWCLFCIWRRRWDSKSVIGIGPLVLRAALAGLTRFPGAGKGVSGAFYFPPFESLHYLGQIKRHHYMVSFYLAETVGFEPTDGFTRQTISSFYFGTLLLFRRGLSGAFKNAENAATMRVYRQKSAWQSALWALAAEVLRTTLLTVFH